MIHKLDLRFIGKGEVKGFDFMQMAESDDYYVYRVQNGHSRYYEYFKKKTVPICIDFEKRIYSETEFKEVYPKAKDFGIWAWTTKNFRDALNKCV